MSAEWVSLMECRWVQVQVQVQDPGGELHSSAAGWREGKSQGLRLLERRRIPAKTPLQPTARLDAEPDEMEMQRGAGGAQGRVRMHAAPAAALMKP